MAEGIEPVLSEPRGWQSGRRGSDDRPCLYHFRSSGRAEADLVDSLRELMGLSAKTVSGLRFANHCARYLPPSRGLNRRASLVSCSYPSKKRE